MKKIKEKSPRKAAQIKAKESIEAHLVKVLKTFANELGHDVSDVVIDIEKEARKLAKKVSKALKASKKSDKVSPPANDTAKNTIKEIPVSKPAISNTKKPVDKAATPKTVAKKVEATKITAAKPVKK
jgi:hypothetical protein